MKRFEFSLARIKQFREQILVTEKNNLSLLNKEKSDLEKELRDIILLLKEKSDNLTNAMNVGMIPAEISIAKRFIALKQQEIHMKRHEIMLKDHEIEMQLQVVLLATQDVKKLEKLEEHQIDDYRALELKETEHNIDEFIASKSMFNQ